MVNSGGEAATEWIKVVILLLYKVKGSKDDCKIYREIRLLSTVSKVYSRAETDRFKGLLNPL